MFLEVGVWGRSPTHSPFAFRRKTKGEVFRDAYQYFPINYYFGIADANKAAKIRHLISSNKAFNDYHSYKVEFTYKNFCVYNGNFLLISFKELTINICSCDKLYKAKPTILFMLSIINPS